MPEATWMVTGATGLLGANAALDLSSRARIVGVARRVPVAAPVEMVAADLSSASGRAGLIASIQPDVVLHCAANASHESCESDPAAALELNATASRDLAEQAARIGARFVYISTDAVFDGAAGDYRETDPTSPDTVYGRTKLMGEAGVREAHPEALVARVNFYGWSPSGTRSLAEYFVNRLAAGERAPGFTDVRVSTMYVGSLIDRIARLVDAAASGIFHVVNDESTTKFDLGRRIATALGADPELVPPVLSTDVLALRRGADTSLNTQKLRDRLDLASTQEDDMRSFLQAESTGRRLALRAFRPHPSGE